MSVKTTPLFFSNRRSEIEMTQRNVKKRLIFHIAVRAFGRRLNLFIPMNSPIKNKMNKLLAVMVSTCIL